jgi:signal peptidase I
MKGKLKELEKMKTVSLTESNDDTKGSVLNSKHTSEEIEGKPKKSALRENIEAILVAIVLALFIRTFVVQAFKIPSGSMLNTLLIGDHILVNKFIYGVRLPFAGTVLIPVTEPKHDDIVVFKFPEDPSKDFIKRVVGVEGDTIEIRNKKVYVNGELRESDFAIYLDPYVQYSEQNRDNLGPLKVPENSIFVMGDNRDYSYDSRFWGFVDLKDLKGKAFMIYWSWNGENKDSFMDYVRWDRIFQRLK